MPDPAVEAAQRALLSTSSEVPEVIAAREMAQPIRELHKPSEWFNCINACCSGEECKHRSRYCMTCDMAEWPCETAKLIYSTEELQ